MRVEKLDIESATIGPARRDGKQKILLTFLQGQVSMKIRVSVEENRYIHGFGGLYRAWFSVGWGLRENHVWQNYDAMRIGRELR